MSAAQDTMRQVNRNAMIDSEAGIDLMIEDFTDPDGRMYRMEYQSTPDGQHAAAFCRYNPWGGPPHRGGEDNRFSHIFSDGSICMGKEHFGGTVSDSPYSLETVINRARYWCTAYSVYMEIGKFPDP